MFRDNRRSGDRLVCSVALGLRSRMPLLKILPQGAVAPDLAWYALRSWLATPVNLTASQHGWKGAQRMAPQSVG